MVEELTGEIDRRTAWGERLLETAEERGRLIERLEQTIAERTAWAEDLLATAEARGAVISELQRALHKLGVPT